MSAIRRLFVSNHTGSTGRARVRYAAVLGVIAAMVLGISGTLAVHDPGIIELDGNIADNTDTAGPPIVSGTDWAAFQNADGSVNTAGLPAGTIAGAVTGVIKDFVPGASGPDPSYHEPSNHDQQGIDPTAASGVWGCGPVSNPTDKDDIVNAYALAAAAGGDTFFYFGVERYDNSGTAFIGVWLFQDKVGCDTATGKFTGSKKTGDLLVLTNFTNGGVITTLQAFRFTAGATPADPGTFTLIAASADCDITLANDLLCGNVNTGDVPTPWAMQDKEKPGPPHGDPDNILEISEFFEGGINLTDAFAAAHLDVPECFGSFLAETRSSAVLLGATLKDYALGEFNTCSAKISIAADGTNKVGTAHTFTVHVEKKSLSTGTSFVDAPGATVSASETGVGNVTGGTCTTTVTDSNGKCTIIVNSSATGQSTVGASASVPVGTATLNVSTNGQAGNSGPATKTWVDARITIGTSGTNKVGTAHTFTVTVEKDLGDGSGFVAASGVNVLGAETGVGSITGGTCDNTGGDTNAFGKCTIIVSSSATGQSTVNASAAVDAGGGVTVNVATDGYGAHDISNVKTWVDARITIVTSGTNGITESHTFTVTVEKDLGDGSGFVPAVGIAVNPSETGVGSITGGTCDNSAPDTDSSGQCTIIVTSNAAGQSTVNASAAVNAGGGVTVNVATNGYGAHDISNVKTWVDGSLTWIKHDNNGQLLGGATFQVCRTFDRFGVDVVPDECVTVLDNSAPDTDPVAGQFKLEHLVLGRYTITETIAPPTYTLDPFVETIELTLALPDKAATHIWINTPAGEGCTPGWWKNHTTAWDSLSDPTVVAMPAGYKFITTTSFNTYFNLTAAQSGFANTVTMLGGVSAGGGGEKALARHGVSALLNTAALANYPLPPGVTTFTQLYDAIRNAYLTNTEQAFADILAANNNLDHQNCPG